MSKIVAVVDAMSSNPSKITSVLNMDESNKVHFSLFDYSRC
jgi:hypothetical protein